MLFFRPYRALALRRERMGYWARDSHISVAVLAVMFFALLPGSSFAEDARFRSATRLALGAICADRHVPDSALSVHRFAATLPAEARLAFLSEWVLPSSTHASIRLALDFTPTQPAPEVIGGELVDQGNGDIKQGSRVAAGGELVSPALDLVELARSMGQVDEFFARVERFEPRDERQQRCRLSLLGILALADGDAEQAAVRFQELFLRVEAKAEDDFAGRWPETLAIHASISHPRTRELVADVIFRILQSQVRNGVARGPEAWDCWVLATAGKLNRTLAPEKPLEADRLGNTFDGGHVTSWLPVSRMSAWSRGRGLSHAAWSHAPGIVSNVASHTEDYLYYRIPLRGDFEVECEVTSFGWRDSHLLIAGTYVAPIFDHVSYGLGSFRTARPFGAIKPRLSECGEWIRYRSVVRNGKCNTYFNGRLIHTEPLLAEHDPWLAIRSRFECEGAVRDLRITGNPVVPRQIRLSVSPDLSGWMDYFDQPVGGENAAWRQSGDAGLGGGIVGRREPLLNGLACERLLQYHRPMFEDGTIEYEFWYRPGESFVYPALDRRAWILDSQGVRIHWVTDGNFERNGLDPLNRCGVPQNRRGPTLLPLKPEDWNHVRLTLARDDVALSLNGELIYQDTLESTNLRTFGFLYWCDQAEARVRNVVWRGNWPRVVPPVESQELAGPGTRWLDERLPQLTAHFEHDFARQGLPAKEFLAEPRTRKITQPTKGGLRVDLQGGQGYTPRWIGPNLQVSGDFDIFAEFEDLELLGNANSSTGSFLMLVFSDPEVTHAGIYRGRVAKPHLPDQVVVQAEFNRTKSNGIVMDWPGSTAEESTSGTFRLARRGDTIYCLFAEADSPHFRLIHQETVPTSPTRFDGVRLMSSTYSELDRLCRSAITWKRLAIRAEQLKGRAGSEGVRAPQTSGILVPSQGLP